MGQRCRRLPGLIPARAGNTRKSLHGGRSRRAHPRSRGEHPGEDGRTEIHPGSSPLARGTRLLAAFSLVRGGLIPARAGNTFLASSSLSWTRAHPRSRGEHGRAGLLRLQGWGSSPLARGTRNNTMKKMTVDGLIPARAGNTLESRARGAPVRAHPRSRGEHQG